jgi:uncharacterized protein YndB with AHSA1/START domain
MGRDFEIHHDAVLVASPEQVWDAVATGPGVSSWFVGRTEIADATVRTTFGDGWILPARVTADEHPHRFAYATDTGDDGRFIAYEYLIEARAGGSTVLRTVTSGFLPGDDWTDEFEAMGFGTALFFHTLVEYLTHFAGRTAVPVTAYGPPVDDWDATLARLQAALGLPGPPARGDTARVGDVEGIVYFTNPHTVGVRTPHAIYRFIRGLHGSLIASQLLFTDSPDTTAAANDWQAFLTDLGKDPS